MKIFEQLSSAVIEGQHQTVKELTQNAVNENIAPLDIIQKGLIAGMTVVGVRFKNGDMFVPEVLMSARAMKTGVEILKPLLMGEEIPSKGTVLLGTVKGDLHDIGKNLVGLLMESNGFKVIDLGVDVAPEKFATAVKTNQPQVVAMSALLTTTMPAMKDTIEVLAEEGLRDKIKVIVGGAPVSQDFATEIGADGYAPDAASATELVERLLAG